MIRVMSLILAATLGLAACSGARDQLGLTRSAPDEFAVVTRAPLEMPPEFTLPPPRPGAPRPQEQSPSVQAESALFGNRPAAARQDLAPSEAVLLESAGAHEAVVGIRDIVDQETAAIPPQQQPVVKRLLNIGSDKPLEPPASVVDAEAEAERLRRNRETGAPVTAGEAPTVKR